MRRTAIFFVTFCALAAMFVAPGTKASAADPIELIAGPPAVGVRAGSPQVVLVGVRSGGEPVAGVTVRYDVIAGPSSGKSGSEVSNADGVARVSFDTADLVPGGGTDAMRLWVDADGNGFFSDYDPVAEVALQTLPTVNTPPIANPVSVEVPANETTTIGLSGSDPEGQRIGFSISRMPEHGSVPAFLTGPSVAYTPVTGFFGDDYFEYRVTDSDGLSAIARVDVRVTAPVGQLSCEGKPATIVVAPGTAVVYGTNGDDVIVGTGGAEHIFGLGGNDTICGNGGADTLYGGNGNDTIVLSGNGGVVYGGDDGDRIKALGADTWIYGGNGDDEVTGGDEVASYFGGDGNDTIAVGTGPSTVSGGAGDDTLSTTGSATLWGGDGLDTLIYPTVTRHH